MSVMGVCTGRWKTCRAVIDSVGCCPDTIGMSPRNVLPYAVGFLIAGGAIALYLWLSAPEATLPDRYNVL